jgi:hypothetical protein
MTARDLANGGPLSDQQIGDVTAHLATFSPTAPAAPPPG